MALCWLLLACAGVRLLEAIYVGPPAEGIRPAEPLPGAAGQAYRVGMSVCVVLALLLGMLPHLLLEPLILLLR